MAMKRTIDDSIEQRTSFDFVRYANCWEDADVLCDALDVGPGDRVLSIASAGDNALALLATGAEVIAADLSPAQLACVDLRRAAFEQLSYERLLAFLGVRTSPGRLATYKALQPHLSGPTRRFWDAHPEALRKGVIHGGKLEDYFRMFRTYILPLMHSEETVDALLEQKPRDTREEFYDAHWNSARWQALFKAFFSKFVMARLGRDPEFFRYVDGSVASEMLRRTRRAMVEMPTHDNPFLEYILTGNFQRALPRYLERDRFEAIRANLDNLTLVEAPIQEAATAYRDGGFDAFNLSDIFEYLDDETAASTFGELLETARPGARMAYWNMMVPRRCDDYHPEAVEPRRERSRELHERDRAFFYARFILEVVR